MDNFTPKSIGIKFNKNDNFLISVDNFSAKEMAQILIYQSQKKITDAGILVYTSEKSIKMSISFCNKYIDKQIDVNYWNGVKKELEELLQCSQ